jgi:tetratricopeptide (TPR) repeat protein
LGSDSKPLRNALAGRTLNSMRTQKTLALWGLPVALVVSACAHTPAEPAAETPDPKAELTVSLTAPAPRPLDVKDLSSFMAHYLAGLISESRGDINAAAGHYSQTLTFDPQNQSLQERAFVFGLATGDQTRALDAARRLESMQQATPMGLLVMTYEAAALGDLAAAQGFLARARKSAPKVLQFQLIKSYLDVAQGKPVDTVLDELHQFENDPLLTVYKYYHVGRLHERAGRDDAALEAYLNGFLVDPSSIFLVTRLGEVYERRGMRTQAADIYKAFLALNPDSLLLDAAQRHVADGKPFTPAPTTVANDLAEVSFGLATIMAAQRATFAGKQFLQLALIADPNHVFANFYLGLLEEQDENYDQALKLYRKVPKGSDPYLSAQIRIAESLYNMGKKKQGAEVLRRLMKERPDLATPRISLAQMAFDQKNYAEALTLYDAILKDVRTPDRSHAGYFFARGICHERLKKYDAAAADFKMSLKLRPDDPSVLNYLGYMWVDLKKNIPQAYEMIKQAVQLRPTDGAIVDSLGWAYYRMGNYDQAVVYLERAVELEPDDATISMHLGDVYDKLGRTREAVSQWKRALSLKPEAPEERAHLEKMLRRNGVKP